MMDKPSTLIRLKYYYYIYCKKIENEKIHFVTLYRFILFTIVLALLFVMGFSTLFFYCMLFYIGILIYYGIFHYEKMKLKRKLDSIIYYINNIEKTNVQLQIEMDQFISTVNISRFGAVYVIQAIGLTLADSDLDAIKTKIIEQIGKILEKPN